MSELTDKIDEIRLIEGISNDYKMFEILTLMAKEIDDVKIALGKDWKPKVYKKPNRSD